jgi:hypothetical protein
MTRAAKFLFSQAALTGLIVALAVHFDEAVAYGVAAFSAGVCLFYAAEIARGK